MGDQIQYNASDAEGKFSGLTSIAPDLRSISTSKAEGDAGMPVSVTLAEALNQFEKAMALLGDLLCKNAEDMEKKGEGFVSADQS